MLPLAELNAAVDKHVEQTVALRRRLHEHPELGFEEVQTAAAVAELLEAAGLTVRRGVGGTGVVATLGSGGPCFGLRADMDALPVTEAPEAPFVSQTPGVMHACGHDFHTAWLAGAALAAREAGLPRGSLKFIFQPAEETIKGAARTLADGALQDPPVDAVCGAHVSPDLLTGQIGLRPGPNLAAADGFTIRVLGAGTHGASPHRGKDPIPAAAEIVLALQTLVSRRLDPLHSAVVSVCEFHAGSAFNIIPPHADLEGTVRTLLPDDRALLREAIGEVARGAAAAHGCTVEYGYHEGVPATVTDAELTTLAQGALREALGSEHVEARENPQMGAEDFSLYLQQCPGALLWVGCTPAGQQTRRLSLHHPEFVGDEGCLRPAMLGLLAVAYEYLASH